MSLSTQLRASLEAIDFQSGLLFKEMTLMFEKIRQMDVGQYGKALKDSGMPALIERHTGMRVEIEYEAKANFANAWVRPPLLDKNHPLVHEYRRFPEASLEGLAIVRARDGIVKGSVNRATGKVDGFFTQIVSPITLTKGLLNSAKFTDAELAAIVMHELGHLFTYFEFLGSTVTTNYVLQSVSRELTGTTEIKRKYQVIEEAKNILKIDIEDPEALVNCRNGDVAQTVILRQTMEKSQHELGSRTYDATAWEMLADQYANRQGAGRHLVTAVGKISKSALNPSSLSLATYLLMEVVKFSLFLVMIAGGIVLIPIALLIMDSNFDDYDKTEARLQRIRRDLVARLKDKDLDRDESNRIQQDLKAMEAVIKTYQDRRSLLQLLHSTLIPSRRRQHHQLVFQQELEKLALNDLFVQANKFENLLR